MRNALAITAPSPAERLETVRHDAAMTARYAAELKALFDCHLDARLREANPKAGARLRLSTNFTAPQGVHRCGLTEWRYPNDPR